METTKISNFTCQSKSFINIFSTCQVSACELQLFSCHNLANDVYSETAKTVFSHLNCKEGFSRRQVVPWGVRDGAVVRTLAPHQCGPGSNPGVDAICGLRLLLVLSLAPRGFSPSTPVFPSPQKTTFSNSNSTRNQVDEEPLCGCATSKSLFIYLFYLFIYLFK